MDTAKRNDRIKKVFFKKKKRSNRWLMIRGDSNNTGITTLYAL